MIAFVLIKVTYIGVIVVQSHLKSRVNYIFEVVNELLYTLASAMMALLVVFDETEISPEARYMYIGYCICATICLIMLINIVKMVIETAVTILKGCKLILTRIISLIYNKKNDQLSQSITPKDLQQ
jgi:hypothetical protein